MLLQYRGVIPWKSIGRLLEPWQSSESSRQAGARTSRIAITTGNATGAALFGACDERGDRNRKHHRDPAAAVEPAPLVAAEPAPAPSRPANVVRRAPRSGARDAAPVTARPYVDGLRRNASSSSPAYSPSAAPIDPPVSAAIEPLGSPLSNADRRAGPARKLYEELVIPADSVIGLQVETAVTHRTREGRRSGSCASHARRQGARSGRHSRRRACRRLGHARRARRPAEGSGATWHPVPHDCAGRWHAAADQHRDNLPRRRSPARESAAKIGGGAVGGAVLGAIFGGKKGAIIGSTVGAAGGGVAVAASEANAATLPQGSTVTVRMGSPATVTVER